MNTPTERSVEEIVEEFKKEFDYFFDPEKFGYKHSGSIKETLVNDWLTQTLTAERQKREEAYEKGIIEGINQSREMLKATGLTFTKPNNPN